MCLVAVLDYDGDLQLLTDTFVSDVSGLYGRDAAEAKWSHATDLAGRLEAAGIAPTDLVTEDHVADRTLVAKARRKVAAKSIEHRAKTEPMIETPRVRLERRARSGSWAAFPSSPQPWYERFRAAVELKGFVTKGRTFKKVSTLEARLSRLDRPRLSVADRLGLYRAVHSALMELLERSDDSYGEIGRFREDVWETYLGIDWRKSGIEAATYYGDLCELLVWEKFGLGFRHDTLPFERVGADEIDLIERILLDLEREHRAVHLGWEADEAACQIAWLLVATERVDRFEAAARRIGSDHWQPIVAMAETALKKAGPEAAAVVFSAANRPGMHRSHLAEQCLRLTGHRLRHLHVVESDVGKG